MSLFDKIFGLLKKPTGDYTGTFAMLNGYTPVFHNRSGGLYESELIRAAINARAVHISKLNVKTFGTAKPALQTKLAQAPNQWQSWSQFLYLLSTRLDIFNTSFIVPIWDEYGEPSGIYCPLPDKCEIVTYDDVPYLRYTFGRSEKAAVEMSWCGIMTKFQSTSDFFGETNHALNPTMDLIDIQTQGIKEGVKSAATYRFMARTSNMIKSSDLALERQRFSAANFARDANASGLLLFPNTYTDIRQIDSKPWVIDADQMNAIKANVFEYFGVNESVLTSAAYGDAWSAFYESVVEPWAIQFSEVMTRMLFTLREQILGSGVIATSNRIQYMSNSDKLAVSAQMADRGLMTRNEIREIWSLPPLPEPLGSQLPVRGEYYNVNEEANSNAE